jgi:hypothetical protein
MKIVVAATLLAASLTVPATAHADCGDPGQDPCTGSVPTVDQVVGIMQQLTATLVSLMRFIRRAIKASCQTRSGGRRCARLRLASSSRCRG